MDRLKSLRVHVKLVTGEDFKIVRKFSEILKVYSKLVRENVSNNSRERALTNQSEI